MAHCLVGFNYQIEARDRDPDTGLTMRKDDAIRHLRFFTLRNVQMDGPGVRVVDVKMYPNITFWAREVVDLDAP